jgi:hypothetical protein
LHAESNVDSRALDALTESIIGAAITVHRELGPGLLEQSYEACLTFELLKSADCRVGLLLNFNVALLSRDGLKRVVNGFLA